MRFGGGDYSLASPRKLSNSVTSSPKTSELLPLMQQPQNKHSSDQTPSAFYQHPLSKIILHPLADIPCTLATAFFIIIQSGRHDGAVSTAYLTTDSL